MFSKPRLFCLPYVLGVACLVAQPAIRADSDLILQREEQRSQDLIKAGYNLSCGYGLGKHGRGRITQFSFFVPREGAQRELMFWVETIAGKASFRLLGPDGKVIVSWSSHKGEKVITQQLLPGKYVVEIDSSGVLDGQALFSAKGNILASANLDPKHFQEMPASPTDGYRWPYLLFVPEQIKVPCFLVAPNNTGFATDNLELLRASASSYIQGESNLAERLGCPLLVPIFPRPAMGNSNLYLHALSRDSLLTTAEAWKRVDLQLLQMIRTAQVHLENRGLRIDRRILLWGFSAAGDFVNRFAMLHPDRVLAVAGGGIGWPIAPTVKIENERLRYPIGLADIDAFTGKPFDLGTLRSVAWFLFRGADDTNDPVDYRDCYAESDAELIRRRFGSTPASRWPAAQRLYAEARLPARLVLYPGVGHTWTPAIREDIAQFFEKRLCEVYVAPETPKK